VSLTEIQISQKASTRKKTIEIKLIESGDCYANSFRTLFYILGILQRKDAD
jgi:hypothetical protein